MTIEEAIRNRLKGKSIQLTKLDLHKGRFDAVFLINGSKLHSIVASYKKGKAIPAAETTALAVIEYAEHKGLI